MQFLTRPWVMFVAIAVLGGLAVALAANSDQCTRPKTLGTWMRAVENEECTVNREYVCTTLDARWFYKELYNNRYLKAQMLDTSPGVLNAPNGMLFLYESVDKYDTLLRKSGCSRDEIKKLHGQ